MSKKITFSHLISAAAGYIRMGASDQEIHIITDLTYFKIGLIRKSLGYE